MLPRLAALVAASLVTVTGCGGGESVKPEESAAPPPLEAAYDECSSLVESLTAKYKEDAPPTDGFIRLEDEGATIIIASPDPGGSIVAGIALQAAKCVLDETDAPASVGEKMSSTNAIMGRQSDTYDEVDVEWSYSADVASSGFEAYFEA